MAQQKYGLPDAEDNAANSPAQSGVYYKRYHWPLLDSAKRKKGGRIKLLDVACGDGNELLFFKDDPQVQIVAMDADAERLFRRTKKNFPDAVLLMADVEHSPIVPGTMDVGIAVNAMGHKPVQVLNTLSSALTKGGRCVLNLEWPCPMNEELLNRLRLHGLKESVVELRAGPEEQTIIPMIAYDFSALTGTLEKVRPVGTHLIFSKPEMAMRLICLAGFDIENHATFGYKSPLGPKVCTEVYTLRK